MVRLSVYYPLSSCPHRDDDVLVSHLNTKIGVFHHLSRYLNNPPQFSRLLAGDLPSHGEKLTACHHRFGIIFIGEPLGEELWRLCRFVVRDGIARERQGDGNHVLRREAQPPSSRPHGFFLRRNRAIRCLQHFVEI